MSRPKRSKVSVSRSAGRPRPTASRSKSAAKLGKRTASRTVSRKVRRAKAPKSRSESLITGKPARPSVDRSVVNSFAKNILREIKSLKSLVKPVHKTVVKTLRPVDASSSLTKAVKNLSSNDLKHALVDWIHKNHNRTASENIAKDIGLNTKQQVRKRPPVVESRPRRELSTSVPAKKAEKKVKNEKGDVATAQAPVAPAPPAPAAQTRSKSPVKSPIKAPAAAPAPAPVVQEDKKAASKDPKKAPAKKK